MTLHDKEIVYYSINKAIEDGCFHLPCLWNEFLLKEKECENSWILSLKESVVVPPKIQFPEGYFHTEHIRFIYGRTRFFPEKGRGKLVPYIGISNLGCGTFALINKKSFIRFIKNKAFEFEEIYKLSLGVVLEEFPFSTLSYEIQEMLIRGKLIELRSQRKTFDYGLVEEYLGHEEISYPFNKKFHVRIIKSSGDEVSFDTTYGQFDFYIQNLILEGIL